MLIRINNFSHSPIPPEHDPPLTASNAAQAVCTAALPNLSSTELAVGSAYPS